MRIGELARRSGVSTATIRFYERRGVLPAPGRHDNGYRDYSAADAERATTFVRFRDLGLEANDAARLADQCATGHCDLTWAELPPMLEGQRAAIAERIAELRDLDRRLATLQASISPAKGKEDDVRFCDCDGGCCGPTCC